MGDSEPRTIQAASTDILRSFPDVFKHRPPLTIVEPPQTETREITLRLQTQPWYLEGYH